MLLSQYSLPTTVEAWLMNSLMLLNCKDVPNPRVRWDSGFIKIFSGWKSKFQNDTLNRTKIEGHMFSFKTVNCFMSVRGEPLTYPVKAVYVGKGLSGLVERRLRMRHLCSVSPEKLAEAWPARAGIQWADWGALWALTGQLACGTMFSPGSAVQARRALREIMKKWKHEERQGWREEVAVVSP